MWIRLDNLTIDLYVIYTNYKVPQDNYLNRALHKTHVIIMCNNKIIFGFVLIVVT